MQKELNPELFGEVKLGKSYDIEGQTALSVAMRADQQISELKEELKDVKLQIQTVVDRVGTLVGQMNEYIKSNQSRYETLQKQFPKLEQADQGLAGEISNQIKSVHVKLGERRMLDLKVNELLDRHNGVLRSFEVRLNHLQKLITEKEAQVQLAQTALNEAKLEIARLKRL